MRLACRGEYEPETAETLSKLLRPGFVFIDLGANEGFFSILGARLIGPTGQVIAVEPQARLLPILEQNCVINDVAKTVQIVNLAVSDRNGTSTFFLSPDINTGSSGLANRTKYPLPTQQVSLITLSALLDRLHLLNVDLMKIDIEGYEYEAILGSPVVFQEHRVKTIVLELHPDSICKRGLAAERIGLFLEECGYEQDEGLPGLVYKTRDKT
jgi:FkbM family methyltransferase